MPNYTQKLNLILPDKNENYDVDVANTNNTLLDAAIGNKVEKVPGKDLSTNDFTDGYKKKIDSMQTLYRFKGTVDAVNDLSIIENRTVGDVYKCKENLNNYIWNGLEWINAGQDIDYTEILEQISNYQENTETIIEEMEENLKKTINEQVEHRYDLVLEAELADNSQIELPCYYKVGTGSLQVYFEGCLLTKGIEYLEVGDTNSISNKIRINSWGEPIDVGFSFTFIVSGSYEGGAS